MTAKHADSGILYSFDLPPDPGTYVLMLMVYWESVIEVGSLGEQTFPPGFWLYCGSARGPGGLAARLAHHARFAERPRWHIDYLRFAGTPREVWYSPSRDDLEGEWAGILSGMGEVRKGPPGFGASDCGCGTHLFYSERSDLFDTFSALAGGALRVEAVIRDAPPRRR